MSTFWMAYGVHTKVHMKIYIKGHSIIIHGITCVSNNIINDVIKFAKFSVADATEIGHKLRFGILIRTISLDRYFSACKA